MMDLFQWLVCVAIFGYVLFRFESACDRIKDLHEALLEDEDESEDG